MRDNLEDRVRDQASHKHGSPTVFVVLVTVRGASPEDGESTEPAAVMPSYPRAADYAFGPLADSLRSSERVRWFPSGEQPERQQRGYRGGIHSTGGAVEISIWEVTPGWK